MKTQNQKSVVPPVKTNRPLERIGGDSKSQYIHYADGDRELYYVAKGDFREDTIVNANCIIELAKIK